MKRLFKVIMTIVIVIVVLVLLGVVGVAVFADRAVKAAVESAGTKTLNVPVEVGQANASILGGSVDLRNIVVKNPPDYTGPALLTLGDVDIQADAGSLLSSQIVINKMRLKNMEVFVEQKDLQNNLYQVIEPLHRPHEPSGKTLIIDDLTISEILVHMSLSGVPGQPPQTVDLKVAPITMTGLGRNERMDTAILISKVVLAVAEGIAKQSGDILPKETIGEITGVLDKAIDIGRTIFGDKKPANQSGQQQKEGSGNLGQKVTEGLKDLLGGKK